MFTGHYPSLHHTVQSYSVLPKTLPTLAERLRDSGYFTAAFCNNPLVGVVNNGLRRGFLSFLNYSGWLTSRPNQVGVGSSLIDRYRQWFKGLLTAIVCRIQDAFARSEFLLELSFSPLMVPFWQTALSFKGNTAKSLDEEQKVTLDGMYNSEVAYQDELVGAFLEKLRASGRLDRTLLVVCADHGDHLGEKQFIGHSLSLYNELIHVPLLVRDPSGDFPRGTTIEQFVSTRRVYHTILEAAGLADESERKLTLAQSVASDPDVARHFLKGYRRKLSSTCCGDGS